MKERSDSIRLIAHAMQARDQNRAYDAELAAGGRIKITVELGTEEQYLADAEAWLDREIVRMAEERIMAHINKTTT